ncbi:hypothetical protein [Vibrio genomosp. F10]|uniref:hypothetical protein n=1 Tax=Vibrio genomosp. F10 TaxID=723171 RepID=UPI0002DB197A|nr:hypothetical protein [Vibrio genomosp. F10]
MGLESDLYYVLNPTLIKNPFVSCFPLSYFSKKEKKINFCKLSYIFLKSVTKFYLKNTYLLISYVIAFLLYKAFYKNESIYEMTTIIDTFSVVPKVNSRGYFSDDYLVGLYEAFDSLGKPCVILPRIIGAGKNPFKLIDFFGIIKSCEKNIILEYEFLKPRDFVYLFTFIIQYPFKTLRLIQDGDSLDSNIFNVSLVRDICKFDFVSLTRYILGKNLANKNIVNVYSWSEFQSIERGFNYAIRKYADDARITALQFYLNYETYFNSYVDDLDYDHGASPHSVMVNGAFYLRNLRKVQYSVGVSLRYSDVFSFKGVSSRRNVLFLGSYLIEETKFMLEVAKSFDKPLFKNHPAIDITKLGTLPGGVAITELNIYTLFESAKLVIGTASGTSVEAVACGIPVVIIASQNNLTANPLVNHGKGEIWDIAYENSDVEILSKKLLDYRNDNPQRINQIAHWYRTNFFVSPIQSNIARAFDLK